MRHYDDLQIEKEFANQPDLHLAVSHPCQNVFHPKLRDVMMN